MAIRKTNPRYRTLETLVRDMVYVLDAQLLSYGTKYAVLQNACREWTQIDGKYRGVPRWTKLAIMRCCMAYKMGLRRKCEGLRHEHAVPIKLVAQLLMELDSPTEESVRKICDTFLVAVVVTKEENDMLNLMYKKEMPREFLDPNSPEYHDPFLRYKYLRHKLSEIGELQALEILHVRDKWWLDIPQGTNENALDVQQNVAPIE